MVAALETLNRTDGATTVGDLLPGREFDTWRTALGGETKSAAVVAEGGPAELSES